MKEIEELFFKEFSGVDVAELPLIFILGSPRTGSTLIYQLLVNFFDFFYFSNFINDYFAQFPVVGAGLSLYLNPQLPLTYESNYGKTAGYFGASEASLIFKRWFGGEHPAQSRSCTVLPGQAGHLVQTMKSIFKLTGQPILAKNAWNCFRIEAFSQLFPKLHFIWIRRDIVSSALSDLEARYARGGPTIWNSATTANYQELQTKPYWEQVVEQQYEYNKSIASDLNRCCPDRYLELWYEVICDDLKDQLVKIRDYFAAHSLIVQSKNAPLPTLRRSSKEPNPSDRSKIIDYVNSNLNRFKSYIHSR